MKYLVTGGAGFIGSHLIESLLNDNYNIVVIDDLSSGLKKNIPNLKKNELIIEKVQNITEDKIGTIDGIFHLAAQASVPFSIDNFFESSVNNIMSTLKVFEWAKNQNVPIVYASSSAVYGGLSLGDDNKSKFDIISPYAQDKLTMEHYAAMMFSVYNVTSIGLRFFNVYGPKQDPTNPYSGVISIFIDNMLHGKPITINGGYQTRDFIYVQDIVNVLVKSMKLLHENNICDYFNVGTGKSISIDKLFSIIKNLINLKPKVIRKKLSKSDPKRSEGTYSKIKAILGIDISSFIDLKTGLAITVEYSKNEKN